MADVLKAARRAKNTKTRMDLTINTYELDSEFAGIF
jgi:hypothetical protein